MKLTGTAGAGALAAVIVLAVGAGPAGATSASASAGASLTAKSSRYGKVLFDGRGRVLYLFTRDRGARSTCSGACARAWPPFLTKGPPRALPGLDPKLLATTRRGDGALQVTYAKHPLYYYRGDLRPGEIRCQNVDEFGGLWLVVAPSGRAIR